MKKLGLFLCMVFTLFAAANAQTNAKNITLNGKVIDSEDKSPVTQATVQLLSLPDSTMAVGNVTNNSGNFSISAKPGKYVVKVSFVGYVNYINPIQLSSNKPVVNLGTISLSSDAIMLKEALVVAEAPQVTVKEDTLLYNSSAYRTPQGAMLEELVRKLPGAEVSDDGTIKINGKEVKKIMVKGKEFFGGDVKTGLKNLPVDMIENLKTYDKKSDLARITGIDDGEEETVLDLTVKKGMNQGWFGNIDLGAGTEHRYTGNATINYFNDDSQLTLISGANNVNSQGFSGGGGARWRRNNGLNATKTIGASFAHDSQKLEIGGSARYNYSDNDLQSIGYSENFLKGGSTFANNNQFSRNKAKDFNADLRVEWKPDSLTNIIFRPNFSYRKSNGNGFNENGTFNNDPFSIISNPNEYLNIDNLTDDPLEAIRVNLQNRQSLSKSSSTSSDVSLQLNRKLNDKGRNITLRGSFGYSDNDNSNFNESMTRYFLLDKDSTMNQYIKTPTISYNYRAQFTYSEPIAQATFLQFSYNFQYRYNTSDKNTYDLNGFPDWNISNHLPSGYEENRVDSLSKEATYKYFNHEISLGLRFIRPKYQLSFGVSVLPQNTKLSYLTERAGNILNIDTTRNVINFAPNLDFRYKFSKVSQLRVTYRGRSSQPSMDNLLPIADYSNPLNINVGNAGLKPSFTHNMSAFYNTFNADKQRSIIANLNFSATQNAISSKRSYDPVSGVNTSTYENVNGNWNAFGMFGFSTALKNKKFTINSFSRSNYSSQVGFQSDNVNGGSLRNRSTTLSVGENLNGAYRNNWFEFGINGSIEYSWERSSLDPSRNREPYTFSYGANTSVSLPWNMNLSTNVVSQNRRGYSDATMNKNELIWNAQIAQTLFKGSTTVSFEMYDILKQQSNISSNMSAMQRSVTSYNSINSYCMVHVIYRLNIFGSKAARDKMMNGRGNFMPGVMPGGMGGGMRPGGMGGGMGGGRHPF